MFYANLLFVTSILICRGISISAIHLPEFVSSIENVTAALGREAVFNCRVRNLSSYKVAWLRVDTQTVLSIAHHVVTKNERIQVSGDGQEWRLVIRDVRKADAGAYMCQVNTEPMISQAGYLQIVVPPDILAEQSSGDQNLKEGDSVFLHCSAEGKPQPSILWKREDGRVLYGKNVPYWNDTWFNISSVTRYNSGAILCIATNGVPPSVSKRILLHVSFAPEVHIAQKSIGVIEGDFVIISCGIEGYPEPEVIWSNTMGELSNQDYKYRIISTPKGYKTISRLEILNITSEDIGLIRCLARNTYGENSSSINVFYLPTTITSTIRTTLKVTPKLTTVIIKPTASIKKLPFQDDTDDINAIEEPQHNTISVTKVQKSKKVSEVTIRPNPWRRRDESIESSSGTLKSINLTVQVVSVVIYLL